MIAYPGCGVTDNNCHPDPESVDKSLLMQNLSTGLYLDVPKMGQ